jgi:hypothetical protein
MKKKTIHTLVVVLTVFSLNVQWFGLIQDGYLFNEVDAMRLQRQASVDGGGGGYDYDFTEREVTVAASNSDTASTNPVPANIASTFVVPSSGQRTLLTCPWSSGQCGAEASKYYVLPVMCSEAGEMMNDLKNQISSTNGTSYDGTVYEVVQTYGTWVWQKHSVTTGIGWSGWWVAFANYCTGLGLWESSNASQIQFGQDMQLTFTIASTPAQDIFSAEVIALGTDSIRMQGTRSSCQNCGGTVVSPPFNSPFIYATLADGIYSIELDSEWDRYQSVTPAFTRAAAWDMTVKNGVMNVEGNEQHHLFYELAMHRIDLTRNGINFESKDALVQYLQESDFFSKLAMSETERENSLGYLIPNLPDSKNYYLTVLTDESVDALSSITVTPAPEKLIRTYYAVYPSTVPIKTSGGISFKQKDVSGDSVVKEYGEIIVKPEMYVFWK